MNLKRGETIKKCFVHFDKNNWKAIYKDKQLCYLSNQLQVKPLKAIQTLLIVSTWMEKGLR